MGVNNYDIAIIGSGIGGSTLGAILARQGLHVVIFEAGVHPKFAVGESMILETSETLRALAVFYDVRNWPTSVRSTTSRRLAPRTASSGTSATSTTPRVIRRTRNAPSRQSFRANPTGTNSTFTDKTATITFPRSRSPMAQRSSRIRRCRIS